MRQIPGVPMVFIRRAVMIMEPPSPATLERRTLLEKEKLGGLESSVKRKRGDESEETARKKKRGPKEPNPLSIKKKKKPPTQGIGPCTIQKTQTPDEAQEMNIIGGGTDSVLRNRSSRHRRRHKKLAYTCGDETIQNEVES